MTRDTLRMMRDKARRRLVVPLALLALSSTGLAALTSGAFFSDAATVEGNQFSAGTVQLDASPATAAFMAENMAPGDAAVRAIRVANTGSLAARYSMSVQDMGANSGEVAAGLRMTVKTGVTGCTSTGFEHDGTVLYGPGPLADAVDGSGSNLFGSSTWGQDPGDRPLAAGASEDLCVRVGVPLDAANELQGQSVQFALLIDSEQIKNNP